MSRLYFKALKCLPDEFVDDDTKVIQFKNLVIAANPKYHPHAYAEKEGRWKAIRVSDEEGAY